VAAAAVSDSTSVVIMGGHLPLLLGGVFSQIRRGARRWGKSKKDFFFEKKKQKDYNEPIGA
jgi:hypothetical protein